MTGINLTLQLAALATVLACNGPQDVIDPPTSQGAAHLDIASGNNQSAGKSRPPPSPPSVLVTGPKGDPVQDVQVTWPVVSGGGTLDSYSTLTAGNGVASVHWTLGATSGPQSVKAVVAQLSFPATFSATAL